MRQKCNKLVPRPRKHIFLNNLAKKKFCPQFTLNWIFGPPPPIYEDCPYVGMVPPPHIGTGPTWWKKVPQNSIMSS